VGVAGTQGQTGHIGQAQAELGGAGLSRALVIGAADLPEDVGPPEK